MNGMLKWFGEDEGARAKRIQIFVIYFTVFVDVISYGLVLTLLPFLAMKYGADGILLGVVFSSYSLCNFTASLVLGRLSDRFGRKPIILVSLFGSVIGPLLLFMSDSVLWLVLSRSITGFCGGSVPVAQAYVSDITSKQERMQYMGWLSSFVSLGIVAGPAIGGLLSGFGLQWPILAASVIAAFNLILAWFILKETHHPVNTTPSTPTPETPQSSTCSRILEKVAESFKIIGSKEYVFFYISGFLSACGFSAVEVAMPFAMQEDFDATATTLGWMWAVYGFGMMIIRTLLVPPAKKYLGEKYTAFVSQAGVAVAVIFLALTPNLPLAFVAFACHATFQGLFSPSLNSLLSIRSPDNLRGLLLGSYASSMQLAKIFVPILTGFMLSTFVRLPFFAAGVVHLAAMVSIWFIQGESPSKYKALVTVDQEEAEMSEMTVVADQENFTEETPDCDPVSDNQQTEKSDEKEGLIQGNEGAV